MTERQIDKKRKIRLIIIAIEVVLGIVVCYILTEKNTISYIVLINCKDYRE